MWKIKKTVLAGCRPTERRFSNDGEAQRQPRSAGNTLVELTLALPILAVLLLGVVEVGNALNAYVTLTEASQEGARLVVRQGPTANVQGLVDTLIARLPTSTRTVLVTYGTDSSGTTYVTVEVDYDYKFITGNPVLLKKLLPNPFRLKAKTTMPSPLS